MTLTEFEKKIQAIIDSREKELEELNSKTVGTEKKINELKETITKAKHENNFKKHNEAKQKSWELENELKFYQDRIEILKTPIPSQEYFSYQEKLDDIIGEEIENIYKEFKPILEEINRLLSKENDIWVRGGQLGDLMKEELAKGKILYGGLSTSFRTKHNVKTLLSLEKCIWDYK